MSVLPHACAQARSGEQDGLPDSCCCTKLFMLFVSWYKVSGRGGDAAARDTGMLAIVIPLPSPERLGNAA